MGWIAAFAHCWFGIAWAVAGVVLMGLALLLFRRTRTSSRALVRTAIAMFVCIGLAMAGATFLYLAYRSAVFQWYFDHPPVPVGS